ncbi:hypothetical protein ACQPYK_23095 [Streptosporangium sp. CA-135522]|uniref:hypothetical protein n=1 Tax=Streptosporangium sp. CA-135522 TaxID=3240072 RepID=UPI003D8ED183
MDRRPSVARNRRRSRGSIDKSSRWASIARRNSSFSIASFTAADVASTAGVVNHTSRVAPSSASWTSRASKSPRICLVNRWSTFSEVNAPAPVRAVATISINVTTPGRVTCALIRNSAA